MYWDTLKAVRTATNIEFTDIVASRHCFVKTLKGNWCRTYGYPCSKHTKHIRGRVYHSTGQCNTTEGCY